MRSVVLCLSLALAACASTSVQNPRDVRGIIESHNASISRWYAAGDADSVASMFAEDAWQMPPNSPPLVGREAIRHFWQQAVTWGRWEFSLQTQDVSVGDRIAIERGKYVLSFAAGKGAPPGMASFVDRGNYLVHWREADGEWRIVADAPVSEVPLQAPARKP